MTAGFRSRSVDRRPRALVLLLILLLVNTLGVSVLSLHAMRSRISAADADRAHARRLALDALGVEVEFVLYQTLLDPLLMLRTLYRQGATASGLQEVLDAHHYVSWLVVLDQDLALRRSWPEMDVSGRVQLLRELGERLGTEGADLSPDTYALRSFVAASGGVPMLYLYQPIGAVASPVTDALPGPRRPEWVLIACDVTEIGEAIIAPRLAAFRAEQGLGVELRPPQAAARPDAMRTPLARILPGWSIELVDEPAGTAEATAGQWSTIAASGGLLLAIALIGIAILAAIRREHALVELRNRFVANVSHELKTPLSLIRMYAETLCLGRMQDPAQMRECHEVILSESERLSEMISDVLDFSRLRQGLPVYRLERHDVRRTVQEIAEVYAQSWADRGVVVRVDIPPACAAVAHDAHGVRQIVLNLVDNAIRYGASERGVALRLLDGGDLVELQIVDFGRGLDSARMQQLWRSVQAGEMSSDAEGSGLGLALVKRICDEHHAWLELSPTVGGRGLTTTVYFPVART